MTKHDKNEKKQEKSEMKKKVLSLMLAGAMVLSMTACGSQNTDQGAANDTSAKAEQSDSSEAAKENSDSEELESTQITVFAAASLENALNEVIKKYNETQPNVTIIPSYDSSGTLLAQIEEGAACDVFFSAAQKQMDTLQNDDQLVVDGTRHNVVNNQVVVITYKGSGTAVTGLKNLKDAKSIAMADGSVPVGKYTRQAMVNAGMLDAVDDVSTIPTDVISQALDGVEINECGNVSAVKTQVAEGSNEVGTVYYSDTYGLEDKLDILQVISYDLTGNVIYPIAQVKNDEADELEQKAALDFVNFVKSDAAKAIFDSYYFDTNVED
ncbi:molybdate ABC transporter, periplasmic molybdate-binding protein [Eubacterium ramulus ATCC 29099]|uniref:Molybdate ABC transporter, periplasmic molybdate-binding protein n=2 Tax=Eubacterium ramulus TaxID=39490 RepID=U2PIY9_EUBRA|nr:molybdate ABC transporter, periplasmic molybdate-binding protein [Eubacterium ramulus ATCC 29099]